MAKGLGKLPLFIISCISLTKTSEMYVSGGPCFSHQMKNHQISSIRTNMPVSLTFKADMLGTWADKVDALKPKP